MTPDTFELLATIKQLTKERDRLTIGVLVVCVAINWWFAESFSLGEKLIFGAVCIFGVLIFREARDAHLQSLRVSLRHIEIIRDPSVLNEAG